ncbi:MAG TPA: hypothetical protein VFQ85_01270 [Mycobacteriales bacterium]|nr:hypothetical protein [Mycobacteriales bacterium]
MTKRIVRLALAAAAAAAFAAPASASASAPPECLDAGTFILQCFEEELSQPVCLNSTFHICVTPPSA